MSIANKAIDNAIPLAIGAIVILGGVYLILSKIAKDAADAAAGIVSGDNVVTRNQTNYSGETTDAYVNKGVLGTLGAATNSASGGIFATIGEKLGGWFAPDLPDGFLLDYAVIFPDGSRHSINAGAIDGGGLTTFNGKRYRIGINNAGQRVATQV